MGLTRPHALILDKFVKELLENEEKLDWLNKNKDSRLILKRLNLREARQRDYVKDHFPFSNTPKCPDWAKTILL